ncbi:MAG: TonB-dependent receptor plug domain-containing protein [Brevinematia bacterium]
MIRLILIIIFGLTSLLSWAQFEVYVIDNRVTSEEYSVVDVVRDVSSKAIGGDLVFAIEEAGIYLQNRGIFGVQSDLSIRGSRFSQVSVALNGVVLNDIQSGHLNLSLPLTIYDIDSISIQKSGNSTIYGSDAIGGIVDFRLYNIPEENIKFRLYSGDYGLFGGVVSVSKGFGPIGLKFSFDIRKSDGYRFNTDFENWILNSTIISKLWGIDTYIFLGHLEKSYGASRFYGTEAREKEIVQLAILNLTKYDFSINIFYKQGLDNYTVNITNPSSQVNDHKKLTMGIDVQNTFKFSELGNLFLKVEGRWNTIDSKANIGGSTTNLLGQRYDIPFAIVGEYGIYPLEELSLSLGLRSDFWYLGDRVYGTIFSPSFKGFYYILPTLKLSGNINRFFRVPSYTELYYYDGVAFGNTNLSPEEGWNYEISLRYFIDDNKKSSAYLSGFWRDSLNIIDFADDKNIPGIRYEATNIRWISGGGIELGLSLDMKNILEEGSLNIFYAFSKFDSGVPLNFTFRYDKYLEHQINASILQKFYGFEIYLLISFRNRFEGKDIYGNIMPYVNYTLINGRLSYEIVSGGKIFIEGYNLGNVRYEDINKVEMPGRWIIGGFQFYLM